MRKNETLLHPKLLMVLVLVLLFAPLAVGCETEEEPALDEAVDPDPPIEDPALDEEIDPELEEDPDYDDVVDPDPPIEDPALDEEEEN